MSARGWIGVDLDGTLAKYEGWQGPFHIGEPIAPMVKRVKEWLARGIDVRIFTARAWPGNSPERAHEAAQAVIEVAAWCHKHIGRVLPVTCIELWDDRCVQVVLNTGLRVDELQHALATVGTEQTRTVAPPGQDRSSLAGE